MRKFGRGKSCDLLSKSSFIDWNQLGIGAGIGFDGCDLLSKSSFIDWNQLIYI